MEENGTRGRNTGIDMRASPDELREELVMLLPRLRRFARALARDVHDADDLVQIALERALTRGEQLRPGARRRGTAGDARREHGSAAMNFSDETVMAYADGELDAASRAALEAAMATDPQLAQRVARHRALRERLRAALRPVLDEPLPERLLEGVRGAPAPRHAANVVALKRKAAPRWSWPQLGAIAASLIGGAL